MLAHFAHIEAYYVRQSLRWHLKPRRYAEIEALAYEYRWLSDCPKFVAAMLKNLRSR